MDKKLMAEELNRIKSIMGILKEDTENSDCYPSDYTPGKNYERKELSKIFSCFAGEDDFPADGVMEWMFPLIPPYGNKQEYTSPFYDPKNMQMGPNEFYTMEEWVDRQKNKVSHLSFETISITPDQLHPCTIENIPKKENAPEGKERIERQMNNAMKHGVESITEKEPFVVELENGLYLWEEGWNRMIALKNLYDLGKIDSIKGKAWIVHKIK